MPAPAAYVVFSFWLDLRSDFRFWPPGCPHDMTITDHVLDRPISRVLVPPPACVLVPCRPLANPIRGPIGSRSEPQIAMSRRRRPCLLESIKGELQSREGKEIVVGKESRRRARGRQARSGSGASSTRSATGRASCGARHACPSCATSRSFPTVTRRRLTRTARARRWRRYCVGTRACGSASARFSRPTTLVSATTSMPATTVACSQNFFVHPDKIARAGADKWS